MSDSGYSTRSTTEQPTTDTVGNDAAAPAAQNRHTPDEWQGALARHGITLRKIGNELKGPCANCGEGTDRFWLTLAPPYFFGCRRCENGTAILRKVFPSTPQTSKIRQNHPLRANKQADRKKPEPLPKVGSGSVVARYFYGDGDGDTVMAVTRHEPKDRKKTFLQWTPAGDDLWVSVGLGEDVPIYRLPELLAHDGSVTIVEGEKCVHRAQEVWPDCFITCWAGGTNAWRKTDWTPLKGREVYLIADADLPKGKAKESPGHKCMRELAQHLFELECRVFVALPPPEWDSDIADWIAEDGPDKTVATVKKLLEEFQPEEPNNGNEVGLRKDYWDKTPMGDAWRIIDGYGPRLLIAKIVSRYSEIHILNLQNGIWEDSPEIFAELHCTTVKLWAGRALQKYLNAGMDMAEARKEADDFVRWAMKVQEPRAVENCRKMVHPALLQMTEFKVGFSIGGVITPNLLDRDGRYFGCANSVVDLDTGDLLPPEKAAGLHISRSTNLRFNPDATHPAIDGLLSHLTDDEQNYLLDAAAYALRGHPSRRWYLLVGEGGTGKTTFLNAIKAAVGESMNGGYGFGMMPGLLLKSKYGGGLSSHTEGLKHFHTGRIAISSELPANREMNFDEDLIKTLTGGDTFTIREIYKTAGASRPARATIFQAINPQQLAKLTLIDKALAERTAILEWPNFPPGFVKDNNRVKEVSTPAAAEAMLAMLVKRAQSLKEPPPMPQSVADATERRREESLGDVGKWLQNRVMITGHSRDYVLPRDLWDEVSKEFEHLKDSRTGLIDGLDRPAMLTVLREVVKDLPKQGKIRIPGQRVKIRGYPGVKVLSLSEAEAMPEIDDDPDGLSTCISCGNPPPDGAVLDEATGKCAWCLIGAPTGQPH